MIKHIVFWKLKEEALGNDKQTNAKLIKEKLEALRGEIQGLTSLEVGIDFSNTSMSFDVALYSEFPTKADLDFYQEHPKHKALLGFITDCRTDRVVVDYEL
jgi:hypothetical protein